MTKPRFHQALFTALAISAAGLATPLSMQAETAPIFTTFNESSTAEVDTLLYSEFIQALTVTERGRPLVAYDIAHAQARPFLKGYVTYLESIPVEQLNRDEQLAYWLNARNILLIQAATEERRVRGFKKKRGTPTEPGSFWTEKRITVSGTSLSLQDIEKDILLAGWDEPNIIFGLYQGVKGGPRLPEQPFKGATVQTQLEEAGRLFRADSKNFRVRGDKVRISSYFDWYLPLAYGNDEAALREHLATLAKPEDQATVTAASELERRKLSTDFEQYKTRQANAGSGPSGGSSGGGYGS